MVAKLSLLMRLSILVDPVYQGLVDKISTFEEFRREKFKDLSVYEDKIASPTSPRWFRFGNTSNDMGSLTQIFSQISSMDVKDISSINLKQTLAEAFESMSPEQVREAIEELGIMSAEHNIQRAVNSMAFK